MASRKSGKTPIPCLVCAKELTNFAETNGNQPISGTEFVTHGHYGSALTDFMDGTCTVINVCDSCLEWAGRHGRVIFHKNGTYQDWEPTDGQP